MKPTLFLTPRNEKTRVRRLKAVGHRLTPHNTSGQSFRRPDTLAGSWIGPMAEVSSAMMSGNAQFTDRKAIRGMVEFFNLYRHIESSDYGWSASQQALDAALRTGKTAISLSRRSHIKTDYYRFSISLKCSKTSGAAPVRACLVWRLEPGHLEGSAHASRTRTGSDRSDPFLTTPAAQIKLANAQFSLPSRIGALLESAMPSRSIERQSKSRPEGQSYPPVEYGSGSE